MAQEVRFISPEDLDQRIKSYEGPRSAINNQSKQINLLIQQLREAKLRIPFHKHPAFPMFQEQVATMEKALSMLHELGVGLAQIPVAEHEQRKAFVMQGFDELHAYIAEVGNTTKFDITFFNTILDTINVEKKEVEEDIETPNYSRRDLEGKLYRTQLLAKDEMEKSAVDLVQDDTHQKVMELFGLGRAITGTSTEIEEYLRGFLFDYIPLEVALEVTSQILEQMNELFRRESGALQLKAIIDEVKKEMEYEKRKLQLEETYDENISKLALTTNIENELLAKKVEHVDPVGLLEQELAEKVQVKTDEKKEKLAKDAGFPEGWLSLYKLNQTYKASTFKALRQLQTAMNVVEKLRAALEKFPIADDPSRTEREQELIARIVAMKDKDLSDAGNRFKSLTLRDASASKLGKEQIGSELNVPAREIFEFERAADELARKLFGKFSKPGDGGDVGGGEKPESPMEEPSSEEAELAVEPAPTESEEKDEVSAEEAGPTETDSTESAETPGEDNTNETKAPGYIQPVAAPAAGKAPAGETEPKVEGPGEGGEGEEGDEDKKGPSATPGA